MVVTGAGSTFCPGADLALRCSPSAMAVIAGQVLDELDAPFGDAPARSYEHVDRFIGGADLREGVASLRQKRPRGSRRSCRCPERGFRALRHHLWPGAQPTATITSAHTTTAGDVAWSTDSSGSQ